MQFRKPQRQPIAAVSPFVMHVTRKAMHQVDSESPIFASSRTLPPMGAGIGSDRIPGRYPQCWRPAFLHCAPTRSQSSGGRPLRRRRA